MKPRHLILIPFAAMAVMVLNVAISFAVVWLYSSFFNPGQPAAHYQAFAMEAAPISSVAAGIPLMLGAGFLIAARKPGKPGLLLAAAAAILYVLLDTAILAMASAGPEVWAWAALSHVTKLVSALAGAKLAAARSARGNGGS